LGDYLLKLHVAGEAQEQFTLAIEKRRIASLLGMTPENLSRAFAGLKAHGIDVDGQTVTVTDVDKLRKYARPNDLIDN
jgi:CRP/FNR family transcriptional activator FtrB